MHDPNHLPNRHSSKEVAGFLLPGIGHMQKQSGTWVSGQNRIRNAKQRKEQRTTKGKGKERRAVIRPIPSRLCTIVHENTRAKCSTSRAVVRAVTSCAASCWGSLRTCRPVLGRAAWAWRLALRHRRRQQESAYCEWSQQCSVAAVC